MTSCKHNDKKHCIYYYTKPCVMKKDEGCKGCKYNGTIKKSICQECGHTIETEIINGTETKWERARLPWKNNK